MIHVIVDRHDKLSIAWVYLFSLFARGYTEKSDVSCAPIRNIEILVVWTVHYPGRYLNVNVVWTKGLCATVHQLDLEMVVVAFGLN